MSHITFVKKILTSGELCKKCKEVSDRLEREGLLDVINHIAIADERNADSEGMRLAVQHQVERAPFFIVEDDDGRVQVFDVFFKFRNYVSDRQKVDREDLADLIDRNPDLDFI
jgi:hypothetical protein